jgi:glycosyltransferase involved in cell wall biosynthesis
MQGPALTALLLFCNCKLFRFMFLLNAKYKASGIKKYLVQRHLHNYIPAFFCQWKRTVMNNDTGGRKKILIMTSTFPRWRGDTDPPFVFDLALRLIKLFDITVLCPHAPAAKTSELVEGIRVKRFRYFFNRCETLAYAGGILNRFRQSRFYYCLVPFFLAGELVAAIRCLISERPDIINAHWLIPQGLIAVLAKMVTGSKSPLVCTLHGGDVFGLKGPLLAALKRFALNRCAAANVVSNAMAETVGSSGIDWGRINVIPMGVDLINKFVPGQQEKKSKSLLFVGRFAEKKGLIYLINAMPIVLAKHPDARLTIVGHGPLENSIRKSIVELNIQHAVHIAGAVENSKLPEIYQSCQIVVFPSIVDDTGDTEGFGLVMVEAMGCGCAVIASDLPVIHDTVIDCKTGLLAPQKVSPALADKIISLLDDPEQCQRLALQARNYVLDRYDWMTIAKKYASVFNAVSAKP